MILKVLMRDTHIFSNFKELYLQEANKTLNQAHHSLKQDHLSLFVALINFF